MRILLTGNKGFIGQNFEQHLTKEGHEVIGYDFRPYRMVNDDGSTMFPRLDGIDQVIHLGAWSSTTEQNVEKVLDDNYEFSYKLLMMCCEAGINMQYASSASVYGHISRWQQIEENGRIGPLNPYAWSKYLFDRLVLKALDTLPIKVQGFRYFNVWGPGEDLKGNQSSLHHKWIKTDNTIKVFEGSEDYYRDFIHVDDVFNLQYKMLNVNESGIYNVGTGKPTAISALANAIGDAHSKNVETIKMPDSLQSQYQKYTCAGNQKILNATNSPEYEFIDARDVNELLEDTRHHQTIANQPSDC